MVTINNLECYIAIVVCPTSEFYAKQTCMWSGTADVPYSLDVLMVVANESIVTCYGRLCGSGTIVRCMLPIH